MTTGEKIDALQHTLTTRGWLDVIRPALDLFIATTQNAIIDNKRAKGDENVTDNELKQRIYVARWVLDWERQKTNMVEQLEQVEAYRQATVPAEEQS